jgi:hypothetical protein
LLCLKAGAGWLLVNLLLLLLLQGNTNNLPWQHHSLLLQV